WDAPVDGMQAALAKECAILAAEEAEVEHLAHVPFRLHLAAVPLRLLGRLRALRPGHPRRELGVRLDGRGIPHRPEAGARGDEAKALGLLNFGDVEEDR